MLVARLSNIVILGTSVVIMTNLGSIQMAWRISLLFGAGIVVRTSRREATGESSGGVHYRRMGWLLLFGLLHAYGLWYGDILFTYALCGLVAWLFRRLPPWALIALAVVAVTRKPEA